MWELIFFFLGRNNVFSHFSLGSFPMTVCLFKVIDFNCFEALFINIMTFVMERQNNFIFSS